MMQLLVDVKYIFEGSGWTSFTKELATRVWHKIDAEWVDIFNDNISAFNNAFNDLYPDVDCTEENSYGRKLYDNFISEKMKSHNDNFNNTKMQNSIFIVDCDPEFMLRLKEYPDSFMKIAWENYKVIGRDYQV